MFLDIYLPKILLKIRKNIIPKTASKGGNTKISNIYSEKYLLPCIIIATIMARLKAYGNNIFLNKYDFRKSIKLDNFIINLKFISQQQTHLALANQKPLIICIPQHYAKQYYTIIE